MGYLFTSVIHFFRWVNRLARQAGAPLDILRLFETALQVLNRCYMWMAMLKRWIRIMDRSLFSLSRHGQAFSEAG